MDFSLLYKPPKTIKISLLPILALTFLTQIQATTNMLSALHEAGGFDSNVVEMRPTADFPLTSTGIFSDIFLDSVDNTPTTSNSWTASAAFNPIQIKMTGMTEQLPYPLRSIMTLFDSATTFPSPDQQVTQFNLQVLIKDQNPLVSENSSNFNMVVDLLNNDPSLQLEGFILTVTPPDGVIQTVKLSRFFAMREYSLNKHLFDGGATFTYYFDYEFSQALNNPIPDINSSPYSNRFQDGSSIFCLSGQFVGANAISQSLTGLDGSPIAIMSSVFLQMGPDNQDHFTLKIDSSEVGVQFIYDSYSQGGRTTGNFFFNLTEIASINKPVQVTYVDFSFKAQTTQQFCSMQWFGWPHCQVTSITPKTGLKFRPNEIKQVTIGIMKAHYDPDLKKKNNNFCQRGFQAGNLKLSINGAWSVLQNSTDGTDGHYLIQIVGATLEIQLVDTFFYTSFLLPANGPYSFQFAMEKDSRENKNLQPTSPDATFTIQITVDNYCDVDTLSVGNLTLAGSQLVFYQSPKSGKYSIYYYYGMGVVSIDIKASEVCVGFSGYYLQGGDPADAISDTYADFVRCQSWKIFDYMCIYVDPNANKLYLYSNPDRAVPTYPSDSLFTGLQVNYYGYDSSDQLVSQSGVPIEITGIILRVEDCVASILSPEQTNKFPLYQEVDFSQVSQYKETIIFTDSVGAYQLSPLACGLRQFEVRAKQSHLNYDLAKQLLDCTLPSHVCVSSNNSYDPTFDIQLQPQDAIIYAGKTLVFELVASLKYYGAPAQTFEVNLIFPVAPQLNYFLSTTLPKFDPILPREPQQILCSEQDKAWSFQVPAVIDPNESQVTLEVQYDTKLFKFDNDTQIIYQIGCPDQSVTQMIKFILLNELGLKQTFFLTVLLQRLYENKVTTTSLTQINQPNQNRSKEALYWTEYAANLSKSQNESTKRRNAMPNVKLSKVKSDGTVTLTFTNSMFIVPIDDLQSAKFFNTTTKQDQPAILVTIIPSRYSSQEHLQFNYSIKSYSQKTLELELHFEHPLKVSSQQLPDLLCVHFPVNYMFFDSYGNYMEPWKTITRAIPKQLVKDQVTTILVNSITPTRAVTFSTLAGNFALNMILQAALSQLWSMINSQQILVTLPMFNQQIPANAGLFYGFIMDVASFDLLPTELIYDAYFNLKDEASDFVNSNFESLGYSSMYFLRNMGTLMLVLFSVPFLLTVQLILKYVFKKSKKVTIFERKLSRSLYWNYVLQLLFESYSVLCMCVLINLRYVQFSNASQVLNNLIMFFFAGLCVLLPVVVWLGMFFRFKTLENPNTVQRFGSLYSQLDLTHGRVLALVPVIYLLRRLSLAMAVTLTSSFVLQILTLHLGIVAQFCILGLNPYLEQRITYNEIFNESIIQLSIYSFICFTNFVGDPASQYKLGFLAIFLISCHLAINLVLIVIISADPVILHLKRLFVRCKQRQDKKQKITDKQDEASQAKPPTQTVIQQAQSTVIQKAKSKPQLVSNEQELSPQKQKILKEVRQAQQSLDIQERQILDTYQQQSGTKSQSPLKSSKKKKPEAQLVKKDLQTTALDIDQSQFFDEEEINIKLDEFLRQKDQQQQTMQVGKNQMNRKPSVSPQKHKKKVNEEVFPSSKPQQVQLSNNQKQQTINAKPGGPSLKQQTYAKQPKRSKDAIREWDVPAVNQPAKSEIVWEIDDEEVVDMLDELFQPGKTKKKPGKKV